jgi:hypothetical protein
MHGRPTASELIAAVREHLEGEVVPALADPGVRYRCLVAVHVLGMVEREIAMGETPAREAWLGLQALLSPPEGDVEGPPETLAALADAVRHGEELLCARIRAGEADAGPFREAVIRYLRARLTDRLRVANPGLLGR